MPQFPDIDYTSYEYFVTPPATRTQFSTKRTRQRETFYGPGPDRVSVTFRVSVAQKQEIEDFILDYIEGGTIPFDGWVLVGDERVLQEMFIDNASYTSTYISPDCYDLSMTLIIPDRDLSYIEELELLLLYVDLVEPTEDAVNNNNL